MTIEQFQSDIDEIQEEQPPLLTDQIHEEIDNFQREVERMDFDEDVLGDTDIDEQFLETLQNFEGPKEEYEEVLDDLMDDVIEEFVDETIDQYTDSTRNWDRKLEELHRLSQDSRFERFEDEFLEARRRYLHEVMESVFDDALDLSETEARFAFESLFQDELPNVLDHCTEVGITENEILSENLQQIEQSIEEISNNVVIEIMGSENYMEEMAELPFDFSQNLLDLEEYSQWIREDLEHFSLEDYAETLEQTHETAVNAFEEAVTTIENEQEQAALTFYNENIETQANQTLENSELSTEQKLNELTSLIGIAELERSEFISNTPQGRLTERGAQAYNRIADVLTIQIVENLTEEAQEEQQQRIDRLVEQNDLAQIYLAQSALSQALQIDGQLFEYTVEGGFYPTENFTQLSEEDQEFLVGQLDTIRTRNNVDMLLRSREIPEELRNYYEAMNLVGQANYQEALNTIDLLLETQTLVPAIVQMPHELHQIIIENYHLNLENLNENLLQLRQTCYTAELNELQNYLIAASPNAGMAIHSTASRPGLLVTSRGLDIEYGDNQIELINRYFLPHLRSAIRQNMTWEEAYEYAEERFLNSVDYFNREGFEEGMQDEEGFDLWQLVRDFNEIYRADPEERRNMVLDLADTAGRAGRNQDNVGRYGLSQELLLHEFSGELEEYYDQNRNDIEMDIQDALGERREGIMLQLRAQCEEEYDGWSSLTPEEQDTVIDRQLDVVFGRIREDSLHTASMIHMFNNIRDRNTAGLSAELIEAAELYRRAERRFNRIGTMEEFVEPLIVTAITSAIALPLGTYLGSTSATTLAATRLGQAGGRLLTFTAQTMTEGLVFSVTHGGISSALYEDLNFIDTFDPRDLAVETITEGLALAMFRGSGRIVQALTRGVGENFTFGARMADMLRQNVARGVALASEATVLTGMGIVETALMGEEITTETLGTSATQSLMMMLFMRSMGSGAHKNLDTLGETHGQRIGDALPEINIEGSLSGVRDVFTTEIPMPELSNLNLPDFASFNVDSLSGMTESARNRIIALQSEVSATLNTITQIAQNFVSTYTPQYSYVFEGASFIESLNNLSQIAGQVTGTTRSFIERISGWMQRQTDTPVGSVPESEVEGGAVVESREAVLGYDDFGYMIESPGNYMGFESGEFVMLSGEHEGAWQVVNIGTASENYQITLERNTGESIMVAPDDLLSNNSESLIAHQESWSEGDYLNIPRSDGSIDEGWVVVRNLGQGNVEVSGPNNESKVLAIREINRFNLEGPSRPRLDMNVILGEEVRSMMNESYIETTTAEGHQIVGGSDLGIDYKAWNEDRAFISTANDFIAAIDGMGGAGGGEIAAQIIAEEFQRISTHGSVQEAIRVASERMVNEGIGSGGAVFAGARILEDGSIEVSHVGDARVIIVGPDGEIIHESLDHSPVQEMVRDGIITKEQAIDHPMGHIVRNPVTGSGEIAEVETHIISDVPQGSRVLVFSDGIGDNLTNQELADISVGRSAEEFYNAVETITRGRMDGSLADEQFTTTSKPDNRSLVVLEIASESIQLPDMESDISSISENPLTRFFNNMELTRLLRLGPDNLEVSGIETTDSNRNALSELQNSVSESLSNIFSNARDRLSRVEENIRSVFERYSTYSIDLVNALVERAQTLPEGTRQTVNIVVDWMLDKYRAIYQAVNRFRIDIETRELRANYTTQEMVFGNDNEIWLVHSFLDDGNVRLYRRSANDIVYSEVTAEELSQNNPVIGNISELIDNFNVGDQINVPTSEGGMEANWRILAYDENGEIIVFNPETRANLTLEPSELIRFNPDGPSAIADDLQLRDEINENFSSGQQIVIYSRSSQRYEYDWVIEDINIEEESLSVVSSRGRISTVPFDEVVNFNDPEYIRTTLSNLQFENEILLNWAFNVARNQYSIGTRVNVFIRNTNTFENTWEVNSFDDFDHTICLVDRDRGLRVSIAAEELIAVNNPELLANVPEISTQPEIDYVANDTQGEIESTNRSFNSAYDLLNYYDQFVEQPRASRELVRQGAFRMGEIIELGNSTFYISEVHVRNERQEAIALVDTGRGVLQPRLMYKSDSQASWRCTDALKLDEGDVIFGKGSGISYTQETRVIAEISSALDTLSQGYVRDISDSSLNNLIENTFLLDNLIRENLYTYGEEIRVGSVRREIGYEMIDYVMNHYNIPISARGDYINMKTRVLDSSVYNIDFSQLLDVNGNSFIPDFTSNHIGTRTRVHELTGSSYTLETYQVNYNGRDINWEMAYDVYGRVWIEGIYFADTEVSSYGTYSEIINSGILTLKPFEYATQTGGLIPGRQMYPFSERYNDITPLISNLQPIRQFRAARNIGYPDYDRIYAEAAE